MIVWMFIVAQSCPALCNPIDCSAPSSSVHGVSSGKNTRVGCHSLLQGIQPKDQTQVFHIAEGFFFFFFFNHQSHQGSLSTLEWVAYTFSMDLPDPGIKPGSPALPTDSLPAELPEKP